MITHDEACKLRNSLTAIIGRTQVAERQEEDRFTWWTDGCPSDLYANLVKLEACGWEMLAVIDTMEREAGITGKAAE